MLKTFNWLKIHFDIVVLCLVLFLLFLKNYTFGTWLTGWDNLMPELNIGMNIKRSFLAVWQEYQGLGLVGGMGHAADLIRQLIILPFTWFLPLNLIRYLWHFAMIALGTFGIYFGLKNQLKFNRYICLLSSLFYLLNFGTIQNFWAPFEPFSTFWGFLPWLIFSLWKLLKSPLEIKNLKFFVFLNLLAIPSFYVPTVFIVYLICVSAILLAHFLFSIKNWSQEFKHYAKILLIIFALNSFWLLPFAYFIKNNIQNPQLGFGNLMSSEETFMRNQNRGYLTDFLLLRGYYYDFPDNGFNFMAAWKNYFSNPLIIIIGLTLSLITLVGLVHSFFNHKFKEIKLGLIFIFFICTIAFLSATPPFSFINDLLRQVSLLDQVFRSPFTKFIAPAIFSFTLLFAFGLNYLSSLLKSKTFHFLLFTFSFLFIIIFSFPSFTGHFISPEMRQKLPTDYSRLISYFKSTPSTARIMNLPSGNYWGWTNYRSGIHGSGFIWYGIQNPVTDRAFDVWSLKNEQYYWELNYALQKQDSELLQNIIKKYSISYIVFDNNIYFPGDPIYGQQATPTRDLLNQMSGLKLEAQFGLIYIYKVIDPQTISLISNPKNISESNFFYTDIAYNQHGSYITDNSSPTISYPLSNLFTNRLQNNNPFKINVDNNQIHIQDSNSQSYTLPITQSYKFNDFTSSDLNTSNSGVFNTQKIMSENKERFVRLTSLGQNNYFIKYLPQITFDQSYLIKIDYRHVSNYPLTINAFSDSARHIFFNTKLEPSQDWSTAWFAIPRYDNDSFNSGLTLMFNNTTFNKIASINDIKSIEIYTIPYNDLISTQIPASPPSSASSNIPLNSSSSIFFYKIKLPANPSSVGSYLNLPQSYDSGWLAFYFQGIRPVFISDHVLVNNWSNGWLLPQKSISTIYVIFWPQILEFIGFALLFVVFLTLLLPKKYTRFALTG